MAETLESLKHPDILINFYEIFNKDCRVSSDISLERIVFIVSNTVFWQNLYVFYKGGFP